MASWKKVLLFGGGGCLALPLAGLLALLVMAKACDYAASEPGIESIRAQLAEIKRGEMDKAYRRMAGTYRAMNDPEDFVAFVARHPSLKNNRDARFPHRTASIDAGTATFADAVLTSNEGVREVFTFRISSLGGILIEEVGPPPPP
jgi:hypothetical protein